MLYVAAYQKLECLASGDYAVFRVNILICTLAGLLLARCSTPAPEEEVINLIGDWSVLKENPVEKIHTRLDESDFTQLLYGRYQNAWQKVTDPNLTDQPKDSTYWFRSVIPGEALSGMRDPVLYIQLSKASEVFIGKRLIARHGSVSADTPYLNYPGWQSLIYVLQKEDAGKTVLIRMYSPSSNIGFHTTKTGPRSEIFLNLFRSEQLQFGFGVFFFITSFVVILIYFFSLHERSILALFLILFFSGLYHISATNTLASVYVNIPFLWPYFFYSGIYFLPASIGLFIEASVLMKPGLPARAVRYAGVIYGTGSVLLSLTGLVNIESTLDIAHLIVIATAVVYAPVLIRNIVKKDVISIVLTGSLFLFGFIGILDVIVSRITERTIYNLSHFGAFQLVIVTAGIIGHKYQVLVNALNAQSKILEKKVEERTESLNRSLEMIRKDLDLAKGIQQKILPGNGENYGSCRIVHICKPLLEVGGDIYDIFVPEKNQIRIFLADATGHGIQAALFTMAIKTEYEALKYQNRSAGELLEKLNRYFYRKYYAVNGLFTAVVADIDLDQYSISYASAGHPDQLLFQKNSVRRLSKTGRMIGLVPDARYRQEELPFHTGDRLFLFSDGIIEARGKQKDEFSMERLVGIISRQIKIDQIVDSVFKDVETYSTGDENQDDRTLIAVEKIFDSKESEELQKV